MYFSRRRPILHVLAVYRISGRQRATDLSFSANPLCQFFPSPLASLRVAPSSLYDGQIFCGIRSDLIKLDDEIVLTYLFPLLIATGALGQGIYQTS